MLACESKIRQQEIFTRKDEKVGCDFTLFCNRPYFFTHDRQGLGAISLFVNTTLWDWCELLKEREIRNMAADDARNICVRFVGPCNGEVL